MLHPGWTTTSCRGGEGDRLLQASCWRHVAEQVTRARVVVGAPDLLRWWTEEQVRIFRVRGACGEGSQREEAGSQRGAWGIISNVYVFLLWYLGINKGCFQRLNVSCGMILVCFCGIWASLLLPYVCFPNLFYIPCFEISYEIRAFTVMTGYFMSR